MTLVVLASFRFFSAREGIVIIMGLMLLEIFWVMERRTSHPGAVGVPLRVPFSVLRSAFLFPLFTTFGPVTERLGASFLRLSENYLPYPRPLPPLKWREDLGIRPANRETGGAG